jgi:putative Ig domain-containing protein
VSNLRIFPRKRFLTSRALASLVPMVLPLACGGDSVVVVDVATLSIVTTSLPVAMANVAYSETLSATGGDGNYTWSLTLGTVPPGMSLGASGSISGVSATAGSNTFTVQVTSGDGQTATRELTVAVEIPPLTVVSTSLPNGTQGQAYDVQTLLATGGTGGFSWIVLSGSLPAGMTLSTTGVIGGTPTQLGTSNFVAQVSSGALTATEAFSITVVVASAATTLVSEAFDDLAVGARGWFDNTTFTLSTAENVSGPSSLELRFLPGQNLPTFGGTARILFTESQSVYISYWVKYSVNWVGSGQTFQPHEFQFLTNEDDMWIGPSFTSLTTYVEHNYQSGVIPRVGIQDALNIDQTQVNVNLTSTTESRSAAGCNGAADGYIVDCYDMGNGTFNNGKWWSAAQPALTNQAGPTFQNDWHFVEAYFQLNSIQGGIGQLDGIAQYWLDGTLLIDIQDALFRTGAHPTMAFKELIIGPYIGAGSPVDQTLWIDELLVADGR